MKKSYKHIGTCIFCGKSEPEVTFWKRPHTLPKTMGGRTIGFDICDDCNFFFGTIDKSMHPYLAVEVCLKEILNVTKYLTDMWHAQIEGLEALPILDSIYFSIYQKENRIKFRKSFASTLSFVRVFTRCFKRGLYEIFLQEYHRQTKDGLNPQFDAIRRFARYNEGDIPVWHMQYNRGIHFCVDESDGPLVPINDKALNEIRDYGMFSLCLRGFWFYLAVIPMAYEKGMIYLKRENDARSTWVFRGIERLDDIHQIDFTLSRFNRL